MSYAVNITLQAHYKHVLYHNLFSGILADLRAKTFPFKEKHKKEYYQLVYVSMEERMFTIFTMQRIRLEEI